MQKGIYRHYKGKNYEVFGTCLNIKTDEVFVLYKPLYEYPLKEDFAVRPYDMFFENVEIDGKIIPRFEYIGDKK